MSTDESYSNSDSLFSFSDTSLKGGADNTESTDSKIDTDFLKKILEEKSIGLEDVKTDSAQSGGNSDFDDDSVFDLVNQSGYGSILKHVKNFQSKQKIELNELNDQAGGKRRKNLEKPKI